MKFSSDKGKSSHQRGIVLLGFVIFVVLGAMVYFLSGLSVVDIKQYQVESTTKSLQRAKQALIAYAASRADITTPSAQPGRIGYLPCPGNNISSEGSSVGVCDATNEATLGWFPWRSLGLPPLRDESGTCLLYAVSGSYKFNQPTNMLNEDTYGMFQIVDESSAVVQGVNPEDRVVAIVFAPGKALPGQVRNFTVGTHCGDDNNLSAYLDTFGTINNSSLITGTADQVDQFIHATAESIAYNATNPHNDRFITITRDDIWQAIIMREEFDASVTSGNSKTRRVTEALARCLAQYGNDNNNSHLPYPAPFDLGGNDFRMSVNYDDAPAVVAGQHFGRFPYIVDDADGAIPGTIIPQELFDKNFTAPPNHVFPADIKGCNDLPILFPAGPNADLRTNSSEDRIFWENRKDHFFYAVSNRYWPNSSPLTDPAPDPSPAPARCGNCITVNTNMYAAVVIYSGTKLAGQTREAPIAPSDTIDTKMNATTNYIEVNNPAGNGMGNYTRTGNDEMFCITDTEPLDVVPCS